MGDQAKIGAAAGERELELNDLQEADVLLARGTGIISDLIAKSDGGKYSHAAMWSGDGVIQATAAGITCTPLAGKFDVYRPIALPPEGAKEIVKLALDELKGHYAYGELVLLGLLFLPGLRVRGALANQVLDAIGGTTAKKLNEWLDENVGKNVRVCSELVASCFYRAGAKHQFALRVLETKDRPKPTTYVGSDDDVSRGRPQLAAADADVDAAAASCDRLLTEASERAIPSDDGDPPRRLLAGSIAFRPNGDKVGVVTPGDLQFSPSLKFIGTIRP